MGESETMRVIRAWLNGVRLCFNRCARTTSTRIGTGTDFLALLVIAYRERQLKRPIFSWCEL